MPRMPGTSPPERYHLVAPLPPLGGWRRMLALDRRGAAPGPVVLSYAPVVVLEDPARLAALARDAEAAARVHHPNVLPVLGLETIDDQLVLVEPYRAGTTVRALLEASGRMPVELAVRVACDVAAGLAALHALDLGDGHPFAHGGLSAERILVAEDGASLVTGVGTGAGRSAPDDVLSLAGALAEMVSGEPSRPGAALDPTGVPAALAAAIDRARGVGGEAQPTAAAALAGVLSAAFPPAATSAVAVYVESSAPPPAAIVPPPVRPAAAPLPSASAMAIPEVSAELIAPGRTGSTEPPEVSAELVPPPDAARTFPAPHRAAPRRRLHPTLVLLAVVVPGFLLGFAIARGVVGRDAATREEPPAVETAPPDPEPSQAAAEPPAPERPPPPDERRLFDPFAASIPTGPEPGADVGPQARAVAAAPPSGQPGRAAPTQVRSPRKLSLSVSAVPAGEVLVDGKVVGRSPLLVEVSAGEHEVRLRDRAQGVDVRRRVKVQAPATPVHFKLVRGSLQVTAPPDTEVFVDGQPVGRGDQRVELWEGWHQVEARRGQARVKQRFQLSSTVTTWTYDVTPTPTP
jgi:hypothetical protein